VFGCFADKDAKAMLQALSGVVSRWYFAAPDSDRALPADKLQSMIQELDAKAVAQAYPSISAAIEAASQSASPGDRILLTGSFLTVAAALRDPLLTQGDSLGIIAL
jgi:dihydrofolate synthase/folylpolyglutamate synthase